MDSIEIRFNRIGEMYRKRLARLRAKKIEAETKSAHWLMAANDLEEGPILRARAACRKYGIDPDLIDLDQQDRR